MPDLLLEIGTEEIPARFLPAARGFLRDKAQADIESWGLGCNQIDVLGTPRRTTLILRALDDKQEDFVETITGPPWDRAFDNDTPTKAAQGFAKKQGIEAEALEKIETPRGFFAGLQVQRQGKTARDLLLQAIPIWLGQIPFGKNMRWEETGVRFARPVRWLVAMLDGDVLEVEFAGLRAGRSTRGHRFFGEAFNIDSIDHYLNELERQYVMLCSSKRRQLIVDAGSKLAEDNNLTVDWDDDLLDEVADLVEWPNPLLGEFDTTYLDLPDAVLEAPMKKHQKYFPVRDSRGRIANYFLIVSNQPNDDSGLIVKGNQRVLSARLADAKFFWDGDKSVSLATHAESLQRITWQEGMGTLDNLKERVKWLGLEILPWFSGGKDVIEAGADLYLADLGTQMVYEFAELQGQIGGIYARLEGLPATVVAAMTQAHQPAGPTDSLPETGEGLVLSIAHRIDLITGNLIAGHDVSGNQDPYGMRRAAIGIFRMFQQIDIPATPQQLCIQMLAHYRQLDYLAINIPEDIEDTIAMFWKTRLTAYLENTGLDAGTAKAVVASSQGHVNGALTRAAAMQAYFENSSDKEKFLDTYKRLRNISRDCPAADEAALDDWEDSETSSFARSLAATRSELQSQLTRQVGASLKGLQKSKPDSNLLAILDPLIATADDMFDNVTINTDDANQTAQRKSIIRLAQATFDLIADFDLYISGDSA